jgi:hypothetical protein
MVVQSQQQRYPSLSSEAQREDVTVIDGSHMSHSCVA